MAKERLFWTGSVNIIGDPRPSGLDMRVYACVSLHDGMSLIRGSGRGCYATFATLTARLGCDQANLSRSLKRLVEWAYLSEERQEDAARVIFEDVEGWRNRQQSADGKLADLPTIDPGRLPKSPTNGPEIVGNEWTLNDGKQNEIDEHYIPLKELDSSEEEKLNSPEGARFAARGDLQVNPQLSDQANVSILERAMKRGNPVDRIGWHVFLLLSLDEATAEFANQIFRVSDDLYDQMSQSELEAAEYGPIWLIARGPRNSGAVCQFSPE